MKQIVFSSTFTGWQKAARRALQAQYPPEEILWQEEGAPRLLFSAGKERKGEGNARPAAKVPRSFIELAERVACHSRSERWALLYRVLWRLTHGERELMQVFVDPDMHRLREMEKAVRRDVHKMRAFVRFRTVEREGMEWYVAWFEPEHAIVELNAPFFVDRFAGMHWSILTPDRCAHWNGSRLQFTPGVSRSVAPTEDGAESLWINYYSSIFNPARVKVHAMQAEMPQKYWKNLPEAAVISRLLREAPARVQGMMAKSRAENKDSP